MELQKTVEQEKPVAVVEEPRRLALPFTENDLRVLQFLLDNKSSYNAQLAKHLKVSPTAVTYILGKLLRMGLVVDSRKTVRCNLCAGTGVRTVGGTRKCIYCDGSGQVQTKTYPVFVEIARDKEDIVKSLFFVARHILPRVEVDG